MYFKKNWGSMAEKGPPLGRIDIFQTSPNQYVRETGSFSMKILLLWILRRQRFGAADAGFAASGARVLPAGFFFRSMVQ